MNLHLIKINEVDVSDVRPLRTKVLRPWYDEGELLEYDGDDDEGAHHFAAVHTEEHAIVGVISYLPEPLPIDGESAQVRLRGMAVAEEMRCQGVGSHLLSATLPKVALYYPGSKVWAAARMGVTEFYTRHDFKPVGPPFEMPSVGPHQRMVRSLPMLIA